jgi:hypothetical protein
MALSSVVVVRKGFNGTVLGVLNRDGRVRHNTRV